MDKGNKLPNQFFRKELKNEIHAALQGFEDISGLDHSGLKGRIREIVAERLLKPILPPGVEIGSGKITDDKGNLSAETDLIIYNRMTLPPLIYGYSTGLFPVEACIFAIEVKSILTATELQDSLKKVKRLKTLHQQPSRIIPLLFAFNSDLKGKHITEIDRYRKYDNSATPLIRAICIPRHGYWFFNNPNKPDKHWLCGNATGDFDEVIDFIGGVANTIHSQLLKMGQQYYGRYIIERRPAKKE